MCCMLFPTTEWPRTYAVSTAWEAYQSYWVTGGEVQMSNSVRTPICTGTIRVCTN